VSLSGKAAVVGVGESDIGKVPGRTVLQLMAQAAAEALDDAGLVKDDIDAVFTAFSPIGMADLPSVTVAEYLGLRPPKYTDSTAIGGSAFLAHVEHAAAAIASGLCEVALIVYGSTQLSSRGKQVLGGVYAGMPQADYEHPYGIPLPVGGYALAAMRHMHTYGTRPEQLAAVTVASRKWAAMSPRAYRREPVTIDDVLASPYLCEPLHALDCCLVTDGGGAVIVTSAERARDLRKAPVAVLGTGETHTHRGITQMPDLTTTGAVHSGKRAFAMAGLTPADIDVAEVYDSFTITVVETLEDLGFCPKGEGGPFVASGVIEPGGSLPLNTMGGGISYTHPGMLGIFLLVEGVRQVRGEAGERQVAGAEVALCHGTGGQLSSSATVIQGRA
jgi:acetyl-CoA acetyltransferase